MRILHAHQIGQFRPNHGPAVSIGALALAGALALPLFTASSALAQGDREGDDLSRERQIDRLERYAAELERELDELREDRVPMLLWRERGPGEGDRPREGARRGDDRGEGRPWGDLPPRPELVEAAYLGVGASPISPTLQRQLGVRYGLVVDAVAPDSGAAEAGLEPHDVLLMLGDQKLVNREQLAALIRMMEPGDEVSFTLIRGGEKMTLEAELSERRMPELMPGGFMGPRVIGMEHGPQGMFPGEMRGMMPGRPGGYGDDREGPRAGRVGPERGERGDRGMRDGVEIEVDALGRAEELTWTDGRYEVELEMGRRGWELDIVEFVGREAGYRDEDGDDEGERVIYEGPLVGPENEEIWSRLPEPTRDAIGRLLRLADQPPHPPVDRRR